MLNDSRESFIIVNQNPHLLEIDSFHITYCSNIHAGESWAEVFENLKKYIPPLKAKLSPKAAFGIGLRLSYEAAEELLKANHLAVFKAWLQQENLYVFTINGFPYGNFHGQVVKDAVHLPDWTSPQRLEYTYQLFKILVELLPYGIEGGISTSPLSYKGWLEEAEAALELVFEKSTENLLKILDRLIQFEQDTGKILHLDIEPEPDGLLENTDEVLAYYRDYLVPSAIDFLANTRGMNSFEAEQSLKRHIQICYDVCHFAVAFEDHAEALARLQQAGILIGKFQISAALKASFGKSAQENKKVLKALEAFNESTYLHQVVQRNEDQSYTQFSDLPFALAQADKSEIEEWRVHFHVPIFLEKYTALAPTQADILEVLALAKAKDLSQHLEVETYTWEVLPKSLQTDLSKSIERELRWLIQNLKRL